MNKPILVTLILFMVIGLCSFQGLVVGAQEPDIWGDPVEACQLAATATQTEVRFDQPVHLSMQFRNEGTKEVRVVWTVPMQVYRFEVKLPNGEMAPMTLHGKWESKQPGSRSVQKVSPGEKTQVCTVMLNRLYDMTQLGEYSVIVHQGFLLPSDSEKVLVVSSKKLKIVIHERDTDTTSKADVGALIEPAREWAGGHPELETIRKLEKGMSKERVSQLIGGLSVSKTNVHLIKTKTDEMVALEFNDEDKFDRFFLLPR